MGPFPHNAPKSVISAENPAGTDGFEFVEFAHPEPQELRDLFAKMGFEMVARHDCAQTHERTLRGHGKRRISPHSNLRRHDRI